MSFAVAHAVAFDVGFVDQVNAVAITEVIPRGLIWIMAAAVRIDIELLHQANVLDHALNGDGLAEFRIDFVTVNPLDKNPLTIHQQVAVANHHLSEADVHGDYLQRLPALSVHSQEELVEVRGFSRPLERVRHACGSFHWQFLAGFDRAINRPREDDCSSGVEQFGMEGDLRRLIGIVAQPQAHA